MNEIKLYRILNEDESFQESYTSNTKLSPRIDTVKLYYDQIERICRLSLNCNLKIASALRIASQYPQVLQEIQMAVMKNASSIPLDLFYVFDEHVRSIALQPLVDFIVEYNTCFQTTGIYLDEERGDGCHFWEVIWEMVRRNEFPTATSRMDCTFAFSKKDDAVSFRDHQRDFHSRFAEVCIEDAEIEEYDMQWVTDVPVDSTVSEAFDYARRYWSGARTEHPVMETLIYGRYHFKPCDDD